MKKISRIMSFGIAVVCAAALVNPGTLTRAAENTEQENVSLQLAEYFQEVRNGEVHMSNAVTRSKPRPMPLGSKRVESCPELPEAEQTEDADYPDETTAPAPPAEDTCPELPEAEQTEDADYPDETTAPAPPAEDACPELPEAEQTEDADYPDGTAAPAPPAEDACPEMPEAEQTDDADIPDKTPAPIPPAADPCPELPEAEQTEDPEPATEPDAPAAPPQEQAPAPSQPVTVEVNKCPSDQGFSLEDE